jgi:hypothetical protein
MVTDDPGAGPLWRLTSPACRVICLAGTDEIKSVAVWSPGHGYWAVRPGRAQLDVIHDFAQQVAGEIVASAWPAGTGAGGAGVGAAGVGAAGVGAAGVGAAGVGGTKLPAEGAELLSLAQELTEPRLLLCRVVGVMAQIAAAHVGFPPVAAEAIGRLAGSLASRLTEAEPESPGTRALQYADVTFSVAEDLTLDVGRVEVRYSDDTDRRLWALDRDPPPRRGSVADRGRSRVSPVPGQRPDRAARRELPGVGRAVRAESPGVPRAARAGPPGVGRVVRAEPPGVPRAARAELRGVRRPGWYRRVPPYRPGPGDLPGRGELGGRGGPPAR